MSVRDEDEVANEPAEDVAHDLNNILQALVMHLSFAMDQLPPQHPARADLEEVRGHASRARALAQRLLDRFDDRDVSGVWAPATQDGMADWDEDSFDGTPTPAARLLVAEDDAAIRAAVVRGLEREGYDVLVAADGEEALTAYSADPNGIALVILDVVMPGRGGPDVYREMVRVRADQPVLFTTGYGAESHPLQSLKELGEPPGDLLQKPYDIPTLVARIREILSRPGAP